MHAALQGCLHDYLPESLRTCLKLCRLPSVIRDFPFVKVEQSKGGRYSIRRKKFSHIVFHHLGQHYWNRGLESLNEVEGRWYES